MSPRAAARLESLGYGRVYDYVGGKMDWLAGLPREGTRASVPLPGDLAKEVALCHLGDRLAKVREVAQRDQIDTCAVVDANGVLIGLLLREELLSKDDGLVDAAMRPGPSTVRANEELTGLTGRMIARDVPAILVTTPEGRVIGLLRRADAERAIGRTADAEEHAA
jgi:predicted transcriptional regulator